MTYSLTLLNDQLQDARTYWQSSKRPIRPYYREFIYSKEKRRERSPVELVNGLVNGKLVCV